MARHIALLCVLLSACAFPAPDDHGHDHGDANDHEDAHAHGAEASLAITRWSDTHELFVELDGPVAGHPFSYHAHVTRLADNHAATSGQLEIRFEAGTASTSHVDDAVARPGIFAATATAPATPGAYRLEFRFSDGDERSVWSGGQVVVGAGHADVPTPGAQGEISFLKEAQWQVPFRVQPVAMQPLSPTVVVAGTAHPAPSATTVVAAPVDGLVTWTDAMPVVGRRVTRDERLAMLVPAGAAEHWAGLQADLSTARIDRDLAQVALQRLEGLAAEQLVAGRRVEEARADKARADARVSAASRRITALTSGTAGAVAIRAPADGVVVEVGTHHGESVRAGTPIVVVASGPAMLIEGRLHERRSGGLSPVSHIAVMRGDWAAPVDVLAVGATVLSESLVYDHDALSAPVTVFVPTDVGLRPGDLVEVSIGVGDATPRVVVPRSAVVEVHGQPTVFVQVSGEGFTQRRVALGRADAHVVEVVSGVETGERVVTSGGFDVYVASLSGSLESHKH